jgi:hypothetical protein
MRNFTFHFTGTEATSACACDELRAQVKMSLLYLPKAFTLLLPVRVRGPTCTGKHVFTSCFHFTCACLRVRVRVRVSGGACTQ